LWPSTYASELETSKGRKSTRRTFVSSMRSNPRTSGGHQLEPHPERHPQCPRRRVGKAIQRRPEIATIGPVQSLHRHRRQWVEPLERWRVGLVENARTDSG